MKQSKSRVNIELESKAFPCRLCDGLCFPNKSQSGLAKYLGISSQAVGYYKTGANNPNWETVVKIAEYLDVSTDWLLGLTDVQSRDAEFSIACHYFGLSDTSGEMLKALAEAQDPRYIDFFNWMLSSNAFVDIAYNIYLASELEKDRPSKEEEKILDETIHGINDLGIKFKMPAKDLMYTTREKIDMHIHKAVNAFESAIIKMLDGGNE